MTIKVFIVDDSAVVREIVQTVLAKHRDIQVIGVASDPIFAMDKMKNNWPDVLVLDVEMPRMDGITFLKQIMSSRPTPVIICSSLTEKGADVTMDALASGAFGIITKPQIGVRDFIQDSASDLVQTIRAAAQARVGQLRRFSQPAGGSPMTAPASPPPMPRPRAADTPQNSQSAERMVSPKLTADVILDAPGYGGTLTPTTENIVAIGTSTGGTQALEAVLTGLTRTCPGIVVVQHMPEKFTQSFAARLDSLSEIEVREAKSGDRILPGRALIAPGGKHMLVKRNGTQYYVDVVDGPLVCRHRPSVDVLFRSMAKNAGKNGVGIIMTGMGDDGARGMHEMFSAGAVTYAQDEASCVVFGMPKEAIELGGVKEIVPLDRIPGVIERYGR
jgi:two-component system chemotaxis response regulator CheB